MNDADLLRQALEALKDPAYNTRELQARIAARLAAIYGGGAPAARDDDEPPPIPSATGR